MKTNKETQTAIWMTLSFFLPQEGKALEKLINKESFFLIQITRNMSKDSWNGAKHIGAILSRDL
jgi:hypothetical protein